ncbi:MAG: bacterial Ig-like domain-containing protein [Enterococcus casseliflavus]
MGSRRQLLFPQRTKPDQNLPFSGVTVSGSVDTSKAGEYPVVYQNGHVKATATIYGRCQPRNGSRQR